MSETALVLRTCAADMSSKNGFVWPGVGEMAEAPDWQDSAECGHGLHGWLYGQGDHGCSNYLGPDAKWLVVEVTLADVVMLGGKCKFPRGRVRFVGDKIAATEYLLEHEVRARSVAVIGATIAVGDSGSAQVGALGTLTGGNCSTLTGGNDSTLTGGYRSTLHFRYWDNAAERWRTVIAYVGEDGVEPGMPYRLDDNHKITKAA